MLFNTERTFGVEIEIAGDNSDSQYRENLARHLRYEGVDCQAEGYNHSVRGYWKIVADGSCGHEIVSPILKGTEGLDEIAKVVQILEDYGCAISKNCGLHVHHGIHNLSDQQIRNIYLLAIKWERVVDRLVAPSRRMNGYCESVSNNSETLEQFQTKLAYLAKFGWQDYCRRFMYGRNYKLNPESFSRHGTIEFRQHQGTLNASKICWWVVMTQNFVERARHTNASKIQNESSISFKRFCDWIGATGKYVEQTPYVLAAVETMKERWENFNGRGKIYESCLVVRRQQPEW